MLLDLLRSHQRSNSTPSFDGFLHELLNKHTGLMKAQSAPLQQRLMLLQNIIRQSQINQASTREQPSLQSLLEVSLGNLAHCTNTAYDLAVRVHVLHHV